MRNIPTTTILFLVIGLFWACNDASEQAKIQLPGRWQIISALRDGNPTETMNGAVFEFGQDGKMLTNLPIGAEVPMPYTLEKMTITQQSNEPVTYTIAEISDSTLVLQMTLRGIPFELQLRRPESITPVELPTDAPPPGSNVAGDTVR
jgi:hypothetical protein